MPHMRKKVLGLKYAIVNDNRGVPYILFGVNVELMRWVCTTVDSGLAAEALRAGGRYEGGQGKKDLIDHMLLILGGGLGHDFQMAERFMEEHWHAHPQLGPYPCSGLLAKCQAAGVFHSGYRDHVSHQLKTYLLGLYVFDNCTTIQKAVLNEIGRDRENPRAAKQEFCLRWLATALAHDAGYILENAAADPSRDASDGAALYKQVLKEFGAVVKYPLARSHKELENDDYRSAHTDLADEIDAKEHSITSWQSLCCLPRYSDGKNATKHGRGKAWTILQEGTRASGLGLTDENTIKDYYDFTRKYATNYGERVADHGVTSALLLLRAWYAWSDFLGFLEQREHQEIGSLNRPFFGWVKDSDRSDWRHAQTIEMAAAAIALHNIDSRRYTKGSLAGEWGPLFRTRLDIALTATPKRQPLALAFLLRLCDTLQDWDRQKFRPLEQRERLLESKAFSLKADDGGVHVFYGGGADAQFKNLIEGLKIALVEDQVDNLVRQDTGERTEYVRFHFPGGQEKPAEPDPDELPDPAELDEGLQQKFRSLSGGRPVAIGVCGSPPRKRCPVRTQAINSLAENARIGSEVHLAGAVLQCLCDATEAAKLLVSRDQAGGGHIATWLLKLHVAAVRLERLFVDPDEKKRPDDTKLLRPPHKCRLFLRHRAAFVSDAEDKAKEIQTAIWGFLKLFGKVPANSAKRSGFAKSLHSEPLWTHLNILIGDGPDFIMALKMAVDKRTIGVSKAITMTPLGNEPVAPDAKELGGYIADRIQAFPHNDDRIAGIWRSANQGGRP